MCKDGEVITDLQGSNFTTFTGSAQSAREIIVFLKIMTMAQDLKYVLACYKQSHTFLLTANTDKISPMNFEVTGGKGMSLGSTTSICLRIISTSIRLLQRSGLGRRLVAALQAGTCLLFAPILQLYYYA